MAVNVGTAMAYLELDTSGFESGLSGAKSGLSGFMDSTKSATDRIGALGSAFSSVGTSLTKNVTTPIVALGATATVTAAKFESGMSKVKAISGATGDEMEMLTDKAIEMGAKTKFSAAESADAFTYMAMAGWDAQQMVDGIAGIMNLAAADGLDLATTSDIVTDALTAFGLQAADSAHFADVLAQVSSSANTNVSLLGESFKYVAPVAGALGMSVEDTAVALGLMANAGIKGSQAGTALRTALTNMVKPSEQMATMMDRLNISATNTDGTMKSMQEIMLMLRDRFSDLTEAEQAQAAAAIFGKEAMSGMLAIINTSEEDFNKLTEAIAGADGRAEEMAETMMDNLSGSIEQMTGAIETLMIQFGNALIPTIRDITDFITKIVEKLGEMSEEEINQVVKIAAIVAAIGPVITIIGKVISAVSGVMKVVSLLTSPIGLVVAAIGALVAAYTYLYQTNEDFRKSVDEAWAGIKDAIKTSIDSIVVVLEDLWAMLEPVIDAITELLLDVLLTAFETVKTTISDIWEGIQPIFDTLYETFSKFKDQIGESLLNMIEKVRETFEKWKPIFEEVASIISGIVIEAFAELGRIAGLLIEALSPVIDIFSNIISIVGELGSLIVGIFTGDMQMVSDSISGIFEGIAGVFESGVEAISVFINDFVDGVVAKFDEFLESYGLDGFAEYFEGIREKISEFISNVVDAISTFISEDIPEFINSLIEWFQNIPENFEKFKQDIAQWLLDVITNLGKWILDTAAKIAEWGTDIKEKAKDAMEGFFNNIKEFMVSLPEKFSEWLEDTVDKVLEFKDTLMEAGKNILNGLWDGMKSVWDSITGWIGGIGQSIGDFFSGIWSSVTSGVDAISGSHANGLDYVPYNGYIAELHQGERVLTAEENEQYNDGNSSGGDTFIFYSNEELDEYEAAKQMKRAKREMEYEFV